jgi:hypothetical protein
MLPGFMALNSPWNVFCFVCYANSDFGNDLNELLPCFRFPVVLLTRLYATPKKKCNVYKSYDYAFHATVPPYPIHLFC